MIGDNIRQLREYRGYTQTQLADFLDISKQLLYKYEKGVITNIPLEMVERIAGVLSVPPETITGWKRSEPTGYSKLDTIDQAKVNAYIEGLLEQEKYKKETASA